MALGHLLGYKANVLLIEGEAFSNTVTAYDTWTPGPLADESSLAPFTVTLDDLKVRYQPSGQQRGAPRDFEASVRYTSSPDAPEKSYVVRVNHPLKVDGVKVFLLGNGYAPVFTVRDRDGQVVSRGAVPFLPRDGNNTSVGVIKVTGMTPQIGFDGFFLPTAVIDQAGPHSLYPGLKLPRALLSVYAGDLGVDDGTPQSVYSLDKNGPDPGAGEGRPQAGRRAGPAHVGDAADGGDDHDGRCTALDVAVDRPRPGGRAGAGVRPARAGRPDDVPVRAAPAGLGTGCCG